MSPTKIALAAAVALLSAPALAADGYGDSTWPAIDQPAPALQVRARGDEAEALRRADPTWPETEVALPAIALVQQPGETPQVDPVAPNTAPPNYAIVLGAPAQRVAAR